MNRTKEAHDAYYKRGREKGKRRYERWTELDINILININIPDPDMAELLGRSYKAIENKRNKLRKEGRIK